MLVIFLSPVQFFLTFFVIRKLVKSRWKIPLTRLTIIDDMNGRDGTITAMYGSAKVNLIPMGLGPGNSKAFSRSGRYSVASDQRPHASSSSVTAGGRGAVLKASSGRRLGRSHESDAQEVGSLNGGGPMKNESFTLASRATTPPVRLPAIKAAASPTAAGASDVREDCLAVSFTGIPHGSSYIGGVSTPGPEPQPQPQLRSHGSGTPSQAPMQAQTQAPVVATTDMLIADISQLCRDGRAANVAQTRGYTWRSTNANATSWEMYLVEEYSTLGTLADILDNKAVMFGEPFSTYAFSL